MPRTHMRYALGNLLRNLRAGVRLACFVRVERLAFRIDLTQLLLLLAFSAGIDIAGDWVRAGEAREFSWLGAGSELNSLGLLLLASAVIAIMNRQRAIALALPVIVLSSLALLQALHYLPYVVGPAYLTAEVVQVFDYALVVWIVVAAVRCVAVALSPFPSFGWLRAIVGGLLLASPIWFGNMIYTSEAWFRAQSDAPAPTGELSAGSEAVLAAQTFLLNHVLEELKDERPGQADLYFVAFAPDGRQDAYRTDAEAAQHVMDARWDTGGRSVVLVNNPQTLITTPFATVSNLRETLNEIGGAIDQDDDVVMLYLAGRGSPGGRLSADLPPLSLVELAPAGLKQLLDDAGIKWRIIVVSACYSGAYIDALQDEFTLIVTDAAASGVAFGCGERTPATFFGDAFFEQGLGKSPTFEAAFEIAKRRVAEREKGANYTPPSSPQWSMGSAMTEKMKTLRKRGASGATVRSAPFAVHG